MDSIIIDKPWGRETWLVQNKDYVIKRIFMKKGHQCSLQYHNEKKETIFLVSGVMRYHYGNSEEELYNCILDKKGDSVIVNAKTVHCMEAIEDIEYIEISTPQVNDLVRVKDNYGRV